MKMKNCKYYDKELEICKILSDFSYPMPVLQPCVESPCKYYKADKKFKEEMDSENND